MVSGHGGGIGELRRRRLNAGAQAPGTLFLYLHMEGGISTSLLGGLLRGQGLQLERPADLVEGGGVVGGVGGHQDVPGPATWPR